VVGVIVLFVTVQCKNPKKKLFQSTRH
jgi:hypothetical protein